MSGIDDRKLADVEEVPDDSSLLLTLSEGEETTEALLVQLDGEIACWRNYCQHWTDVRLDKGSGARVRDGEIWCQKHAATFDSTTGECTFGPCEGAYLREVEVDVRDGSVYLSDDDYEFAHLGPSPDTDDSVGGSGGRIDFTGS